MNDLRLFSLKIGPKHLKDLWRLIRSPESTVKERNKKKKIFSRIFSNLFYLKIKRGLCSEVENLFRKVSRLRSV